MRSFYEPLFRQDVRGGNVGPVFCLGVRYGKRGKFVLFVRTLVGHGDRIGVGVKSYKGLTSARFFLRAPLTPGVLFLLLHSDWSAIRLEG